uniref:polynucleotide adenylyltransferase n=1 Tax=Globodera rostochiensis TaxID=31243 RepID=A0A914HZ60_GLORO
MPLLAFFLLSNLILLSHIVFDTSAVGIAIEKLYCSYLISTDEELPDKAREKLRRTIAVELLDKAINEAFEKLRNIGKEKDKNEGQKIILGELEGKYGHIRDKKREALDESGDDRLDNYTCQLWTILSQLKTAKNDEIGTFLLNLKECNRLDQIGTHGAKEEKGRMANFQSDLATWHQQNLEGMLAHSIQRVRKLSELFDGQRTEWESELAFRLRQIAVSDTAEHWDFRVKLATQRMFELVGGRPDLFNLLDWILRLYIELFLSESELAKRKTMLSLGMIIYIRSVNVLIGQKRGRGECGWTSFRRELAKSFDSIQLIESEHQLVSAELETMSYLVLLHRLEKELEQLSELSEGWTVFNFLNKPRKNGEGRMKAIVEEVRLQLERKNAELIESFIDTKKEFRKTFQEVSGVQLVQRLIGIFGHSQMPKIGKLIRKSREREGVPRWYLDTQRAQFDYCPDSDSEFIAENYRDSDGHQLVQSYEQLLVDDKLFRAVQAEGIIASDGSLLGNLSKELRHAKLAIHPKSTFWLINSFIDEFLTYSDTFFAFGGDKNKKNIILNNLWTHWAVTLAKVQKLNDEQHKFCQIFAFSMILVNTIWTGIAEEERGHMAQIMSEMRWDEITIFELKWKRSAGKEPFAAIVRCDGPQEIEMYWQELMESPNAELVQSLTLFRLLKRFKGFSHFLCQKMRINTVDTKDRLLLLIHSTSEFEWFEKQFPLILRIESINFRLRLHFYRKMFIYQSWSDEYRYNEFRMVLSILLEELNLRLFLGIQSDKFTSQTLQEAALVVHNEIFREIGTSIGICRLMYLLKSIEESQNVGTKVIKFVVTAKQLKECVKSGAKLKQFKHFWGTVQENHIEFLKGSKGNALPLFMAISTDVPGAKARLDKIVGDRAYRTFWELGLWTFSSTEMFDKEIALSDHYLIVFFMAQTEFDRIINKLAADLIIFVQWLDSEPKGLKMEKFWEKKRALEMERTYDRLFDIESGFELEKTSLAFEELFKGLKNFLEANRNVGIENKLLKEWDKKVKRVEKEAQQRNDETGEGVEHRMPWNLEHRMPWNLEHRMPWNLEHRMPWNFEHRMPWNLEHRMPKWILEMHGAKFKKWIKNDLGRVAKFMEEGWFVEELKKGLEVSTEVRRRLGWFLETEEINELLGELGILFDGEEIVGKDEDDEERKRKKNDKAKRKKKKNAKIGKKETESMGEQSGAIKKGDEKVEMDSKATILEGKEEEAAERMEQKRGEDEEEKEAASSFPSSQSPTEKGKGNSTGKCQHFRANVKSKESHKRDKKGRKKEQRKGTKSANNGEISSHFLVAIPKEPPKTDESKELNGESDANKTNCYLIGNIDEDAFLFEYYRKNVVDGTNFSDSIMIDLSVYSHEIQHQIEVNKLFSDWRKVKDQMQLDENLQKNYVEKGFLLQNRREEWRDYVEYMQEIKFEGPNDAKAEELVLDGILHANGFITASQERNGEIRAKIETMRQIVKDWSKGKGTLLVGGSFLLGVHTVESDVDTICVVPEHITSEQFFGTRKCTPRARHKCDEDSLMCAFCQRLNVQSLQRIANARVPLLKVTLACQLKIDILFASIPGLKSIKIDGENSAQIADLIGKLADRIKLLQNSGDQNDKIKSEQMQRMVRSLAGYHSNLKLIELNQNFDTHRKFVLALKLWAKNNYIYSNILGFFGGVSLNVLATKIALIYPGASVPFMLKRFFLTFCHWEWPLPVQIDQIASDPLSWSPEGELQQRQAQFGVGLYAKMTMAVIAPGYPQQNTTFNVNIFTAKIIEKTMRETLNQLHLAPFESQINKWTKVFERRLFSQMYSEFLVIICVASDNELNEEFCGFVATRIRPLLLTSGECAQDEVNFCHATALECRGGIMQEYKLRSPNAICKAWVVGLNVIWRPKFETETAATEWKRQNFEEQLLDSYKRIVLRAKGEKKVPNSSTERIWKLLGKDQQKRTDLENNPNDFVHLDSKYVERGELATNWRI